MSSGVALPEGGNIVAVGGTGGAPVPPGRWPGGRLRVSFGGTHARRRYTLAVRSGRRVADRHRQVACATRSAKATGPIL